MESSNEEQIKAMLEVFDFTKDETLTVEKIVKACFLNPDRKKFKIYSAKHQLLDIDSPETILQMWIPEKTRFEAAEIKLHSTEKLHENTNKEIYLNRLKNSRWYGPFGSLGDDNYVCFVSGT